MPIDALMADRKFACNLLVAPLNAKIVTNIGPDLGVYTAGIVATLGSLRRFGACLLSTITTLATTADKFAADGAAAPALRLSDRTDGLFGFQEALNLVSFFLAEVLVHWATLTWRLKQP